MKERVYLITGAAGFLGGHVCRKLIERGEKVRIFSRPTSKGLLYLPEDIDVVKGDLTCFEDLDRFFTVPEGVETVCLHIASVVAVDEEYSSTVMNTNIGGTKNIIQCMKKHPECKKLVYCSSTGAIPEEKKGKKMKEIVFFDHTLVRGCYSQSKAIATQIVLDAVEQYDIDACVVHPAGIMGPEDYAMSETTSTLLQIIKGELPAGMDGSFNLCDVRDLADGCIAAVDKGRKGECYILANEVVTFKEFCKIVCEEAKCKPVKMFLSIPFAYKMAKIMERQAKKKGRKPLMTTFSVYNLDKNNEFDCSKAKNELGYKTRPYSETMRDCINWLRETGKID